MPLGRKLGLDSTDIVLDGDPAPPPQKRGHSPTNFRPMFVVANGWIGQDATRYAQATLC